MMDELDRRNPFLHAARYDDELHSAVNRYINSGLISHTRINIGEGFATAYKLDRNPKIDYCLLIHSKPSLKTDNSALDRFKGLVRVLQKVSKIKGRATQVKGYQNQLCKSPKFSDEDLRLYIPAIKFFSEEIDVSKFLHRLEPR